MSYEVSGFAFTGTALWRVMFRMNCMPRAEGCAGAACVSFAQILATCVGAEVARYLSSGLATSTSVWARARHPCRSRSKSKVPHTLCAVRSHSAMVSKRCNATPASAISCAHLSESTVLNLPTKPRGCGVLFQDRTRQEVMFRMNGMPRAQGCARLQGCRR